MAHTAAELTWLGYLLDDLRVYPTKPPILYGDNLSALHLTVNPVLHTRSKHVALDYHYVRERIAQGVLITRYIPSAYQVADIFTKSMTKTRLAQFRRKFCLHPGHSLRGDISSGSHKDDLSDNELSGTILNKSGGNLSGLRVLLLRGNHFSGFIPNWLCQLNIVSLLDLLRNSFSGSIPHCLYNLSFGREGEGPLYGPFSDKLVEWGIGYWGSSKILLDNTASFDAEVDEENNNLTGEILYELGALSHIHALNLSRNQLTGSIPRSFSNLSQIESLDLSYNILSGQIPVELIDLNFLEVFSVAHNNLSDRISDMKGQFSTFNSKSYEGNPFLCGTQVRRKCHDDNDEPSPSQMESPKSPQEASEKWYEIDREIFLASFSITFIMFFLSAITILYVNPYWQ
ncbi:receptor-like protein 9b [Manihot esculenta]|uniref:receptor-like protein 9b n=1 Tax=Manihot esculenta TaxID=3983 RepID=UPI000B5D86B2|nr:receptor-like protein 9b [Manihot esculenta]